MNISDFVGKLSVGLARQSRYTVVLTPPTSILQELGSAGNSATLETILLFCDQVQLPGVGLQTNQTRNYGEVREMPYEINYEPITMSFYVDTDMVVKRLFDLWILSVQDKNTRNFNYYDSYTCPMQINVQSMEDENKYGVKLLECYPKTVSSVTMDYASKDVMKLQVTMMYKYWRSARATDASQLGVDISQYIYDAAFPPFDYTMGFMDFQELINQNMGVQPEGLDEFTGVVEADY